MPSHPATVPTPGAFAAHRLPRLVAPAVLALAIVLRLANFAVTDRSPDERLYARYGAAIAREGPAYITRVTHAWNRDEEWAEYPWQQRIGFTALYGLAMRITGDSTPTTGAGISCACSIALVGVTGAIGFELLAPWTAVAAMLFLAVSPLDLALARRAWQDDVMALVTLLLLWSVLRRVTRGGRAPLAAFFGLAAWALLVKESAVIPAGLGTLALAFDAWARERRAIAPLRVLALGAATALFAAGIVIAVSGGWSELVRCVALGREALAPDDYMRNYQSGGPGYYLTGMRLLQPLPFLLGGIATLLALVRPAWLAREGAAPRAERVLRVIAGLVAIFAAVSFAYASKNLRFLSPIYAPVALLAAVLVTAALAAVRARAPRRWGRLATALVVLALAASALRDVATFDRYFNQLGIQDLATPWFTQADARARAGQ